MDLNDDQWLQASLPVRDGGLGIRSAQMLAPSAILASAASTHALQQSILPDSINSLKDPSVACTKNEWSSLAGPAQQLIAGNERHTQKEWDKPVAENHQAQLFLRAVSDLDKARLLAVASLPFRGLAPRASHNLSGFNAV